MKKKKQKTFENLTTWKAGKLEKSQRFWELTEQYDNLKIP